MKSVLISCKDTSKTSTFFYNDDVLPEVDLFYNDDCLVKRAKKLKRVALKSNLQYVVFGKPIFQLHFTSSRRWNDLIHNVTILSFDRIGFVDEPSRFGEFIAKNKTIQSIQFEKCLIGHAALDGITSNTKLHTLIVRNCIFDTCLNVDAFGEIVARNSNLCNLAISQCRWYCEYEIFSHQSPFFLPSVAKNIRLSRLKYLDCRTYEKYSVSEDDINAIILIAEKNRFLKEFDFGDLSSFADVQTNVGKNITEICTGLKNNHSVESFGSTVWKFPHFREPLRQIEVRNRLLHEWWDNSVKACLGLESLQIPPYVVLEIIDWLPYVAELSHMKKINMILRIREFSKQKQR